jgi:hypothetical protein
MPVEKQFTKMIPKIYKHHAENIGLFFWIKAQLAIVPTVRIDQAVMSYMRFTGITLDEWDVESACSTYTRMQKEFIGDCKNETSEANR